jgi:hypothetical protein
MSSNLSPPGDTCLLLTWNHLLDTSTNQVFANREFAGSNPSPEITDGR